jgi:eukaryotic-like serine/threonine-protein kinase
MFLAPGTRVGNYEIVTLLGSGGMGEVYQASDLRLRRQVAIKILPDAVAREVERMARFEREARLLAALNHPHIAAIHGLEESVGRLFLVMELVEGPTLSDRIGQVSRPRPERTGLPPSEALTIAIQIADALAAAHDKGVIHRDLKPSNIKLTVDGQVKLLDFGLAKAYADETPEPNLSNSPTLTLGATNAGVILGTAAYMSPEQARGKPVDRRTDIFAFGCVLYEMLTGQPAFEGDSVSQILARVIERDPDWKRLPAGLHPRVDEVLRRCLEKDPRQRRRDIGDVRLEIERAMTEPARVQEPATQAPTGSSSRLAWIIAGVLALGLLAASAASYLRPPADVSETRLEINAPAALDPFSFALSPDGRRLVFVAAGSGQPQLYLRSLDSTMARPLAGTEGAAYPFWSPDGQSVGFFAGNNKLNRVDVGGGLPQILADVAPGFGGTWGPDGSILFSPGIASSVLRVAASGGQPVAVTKLVPPQQTSHRFPQFLPDGRQFLFFVDGTPDAQGIYLGSLGSTEIKRLTLADSFGTYVAPGWLVFGRQETLLARRFDVARGELTGEPVTLADSVLSNTNRAIAFSASTDGPLAYRAGDTAPRQLTWFDRSGKVLGTLGPNDNTDLADPELSPDGRQVAVTRRTQNNADVWILDATRSTRFTFDGSIDQMPIWSPDGSEIVFNSDRKGAFDIYRQSSSSASSDQTLFESPLLKRPTDWSPDGRFLMYFTIAEPRTGPDLWVLPLQGAPSLPGSERPTSADERKPFPFLTTEFGEVWGQFSPDGPWVLYQSNESGRWEVYVRPFPGPGGKWLVSSGGGIYPRWGRTGKELYYIAPDGTLMAVSISARGPTLDAGTPVKLFRPPIFGGGVNMVGRRHQYDVAPDGRFLINIETESSASSPITIVLNWKPGEH